MAKPKEEKTEPKEAKPKTVKQTNEPKPQDVKPKETKNVDQKKGKKATEVCWCFYYGVLHLAKFNIFLHLISIC